MIEKKWRQLEIAIKNQRKGQWETWRETDRDRGRQIRIEIYRDRERWGERGRER